MKPRSYRPQQRSKFYRINFFIQARELRVLDEQGKQLGVFTKEEAIRRAKEQGLDVVEIAAKANPPVAKIIDFKKFKYLESRKDREDKKKQKNVGVKEIRLRPFIGQHDLDTKVEQAKEFLNDGNQVKIAIPFKGREITRKEFGFEVMKRFLDEFPNIKIVREAHFEGKVLTAMVVPDKKSAKDAPKEK